MCAAVQQRLTTPQALSAELSKAGAIRHCKMLKALLGDIEGGGHTLAEIDLGRLAKRAGLSPPRRQRLRKDVDGRVRYIDAEFVLPDGSVLLIEVDGAVHLRPITWWDDMERQNEFVVDGKPVLRFASMFVRFNEEYVVDTLRRFKHKHSVRAVPNRSGSRRF